MLAYFAENHDSPMATTPEVKTAVRDLLRHGGFKPTGRNKPASEYLRQAVDKGWFGPDKGINLAVDLCNVVSLHSGIPISVLDAHLAVQGWSITIAAQDASYAFNPAGQVIDIGGLVVFNDAAGPCGGPVKDSQRTKTHEATTMTLSIIWGTEALPGRSAAIYEWYTALVKGCGLRVQEVAVEHLDPA